MSSRSMGWGVVGCAVLAIVSASCSSGLEASTDVDEPMQTASQSFTIDAARFVSVPRPPPAPLWAGCIDSSRWTLATRFLAARPRMHRVPLSVNGVRVGSVAMPVPGPAACSAIPGRGGEWVAQPVAQSHFCTHSWRAATSSLPDYEALEAGALAAVGRPGGAVGLRDPIVADCRPAGVFGPAKVVGAANVRSWTERSMAGRHATEQCLANAKRSSTFALAFLAQEACLSSLTREERAAFDACRGAGHDVAWCVRQLVPLPRVPQCGSCGMVDPRTREILVVNPMPAVTDAKLTLHLPQSGDGERVVVVVVERVNAPVFTLALPEATLAHVGSGFFVVE